MRTGKGRNGRACNPARNSRVVIGLFLRSGRTPYPSTRTQRTRGVSVEPGRNATAYSASTLRARLGSAIRNSIPGRGVERKHRHRTPAIGVVLGELRDLARARRHARARPTSKTRVQDGRDQVLGRRALSVAGSPPSRGRLADDLAAAACRRRRAAAAPACAQWSRPPFLLSLRRAAHLAAADEQDLVAQAAGFARPR